MSNTNPTPILFSFIENKKMEKYTYQTIERGRVVKKPFVESNLPLKQYKCISEIRDKVTKTNEILEETKPSRNFAYLREREEEPLATGTQSDVALVEISHQLLLMNGFLMDIRNSLKVSDSFEKTITKFDVPLPATGKGSFIYSYCKSNIHFGELP